MRKCTEENMSSRDPVRNLSGKQGFTLFEILVALAVMGIAFVSIFQLFAADIRAVNASDDYSIAVMMAESKMREILDDDELSERTWTEISDDGYRFEAAVSGSAPDRTETLPVQVLEITLQTTWSSNSGEKSFSLKTMKVVRKKA